jgi:uncharacterized protein YprB with RNaseH-like and TPR domain
LSSLADRIRGVVSGRGTNHHPPITDRPQPPTPNPQSPDLSALRGNWREGCFVVDREWAPGASHGRERIGDAASRLEGALGEASMFTGGSAPRPPFLFFDLETTGLNGGAGTHVFLIGCGWFDGDRFVTRQFVMTRFTDEPAMLAAVANAFGRAGALVSFNGKSFDAPVLETRYLFHRLAWIAEGTPHIDVLHPARQFWKRDDCSLVALEKQLVGHRRVGDVPGFEIPARYFQYVRSGNAGPLAAVLEHNRLDLLSLAVLTARLLHLARTGPDGARDAREAIALGRVYGREGHDVRAYEAFAHAAAMSRAPATAFDAARIDALRGLALTCRRMRRFDEAARHWQALLDIRGCPASVAGEAAEALAIHHEHRVRDLELARTFALRNLETIEGEGRVGRTQAGKHRLGRIEWKLEVRRQKVKGKEEAVLNF